ncbi:MAG: L,D-transpeptidase [bacterium]|jgi:L,D-transpeptidase ErfK/SrfK|nr:L,D-transpeptidase [bacterium]
MPFLLLMLVIFSPQYGAGEDLSQEQLEREIRLLESSLEQQREKNAYIVIDTQHNSLTIFKDNQILHQAICSTGSGKVLRHPSKQDEWQFTTPVGLWHVQRKVTDPIWAKPVWAFVETGDPIPVLPWAFHRLDQTTLGAYALELGDGYEIHGTLYPALLGRHITHGCIRLNEDDLALTYEIIEAGSRVYIY